MSADCVTGVIRWEVARVRSIRPESLVTSPITRIAGLSWNIGLSTSYSHAVGERILTVFLNCENKAARDYWRCDHKSTIKMINRMDPRESESMTLTLPFSIDLQPCTTPWFYLWRVALHEQQGFIENNKLLFEAHIQIADTTGVLTNVPEMDYSAEGDTTDVCLIVDEKNVFVIKSVLALHSPVFRAMFYGNYSEKDKKEVPLNDVKHEDFIAFLNVICVSTREITDRNVESVLLMADRFQVKSVLEAAEDFLMHTSKRRLAEKLLLSDKYRLELLQGLSLWHFKTPSDLATLEMDNLYKDFSVTLKSKICARFMAISYLPVCA